MSSRDWPVICFWVVYVVVIFAFYGWLARWIAGAA